MRLSTYENEMKTEQTAYTGFSFLPKFVVYKFAINVICFRAQRKLALND